MTVRILGVTFVLVASVVAGAGASARVAGPAVLTVFTGDNEGPVPAAFLGANHRYTFDGYGTWDSVNNRPDPDALAKAKAMGVQVLRWPGGTVANTTQWKGIIGTQRWCQRDGRIEPGDPANPADDVLAARNPSYGLDEHLRFAAALGAQTQVMVPMAIGTPADAADLVEYLNTPAGDGINPNGGTDWAELRPEDHRQPYRITRWELGNENFLASQRYWMSPDDSTALDQYIKGGARRITGERLGKLSVPDAQGRPCGGSTAGVASDATAKQVFDLRYPTAQDVDLRVGGESWQRVDSLDGSGPQAKQYALDELRGTVTFGDGVHGMIPPRGKDVVADYTSVHKGYTQFRAAMREVDPSLAVCAAWGRPPFARRFEALKGNGIPANSDYDCLTVHPYTHFSGSNTADWDSRTEAHDWHMIGAQTEREEFVALRNAQGGRPVAISEFGALGGPDRGGPFPAYTYAMTHALYMATQWATWLDLGVPWVEGNDLTSDGMYTLLGRDHVYSAEAWSREAVRPMFDAGGIRLRTTLTGNPRRDPDDREMCDGPGTPQDKCRMGYADLVATATRAPDGAVYVMVVNRSPADAVDAEMALRGFTGAGRVRVRTVAPESFSSANTPENPNAVRMTESCRAVGPAGFSASIPAHSVTLFTLPPQGRPSC
jgi:alpha-N-arabinofuranosidase